MAGTTVPPPLAGCDVLLVEDEIVIALMVEDMLRELGARSVFHATTVAEALDILARVEPHCAVLDVNLGGDTAYAIAERLQARRIPFVFATGYGQHGIASRWQQQTVLQKPFEARLLAHALRAIRE